MAKQARADVLVKLIVGAGQAAPTPPVGPALGSKGVKSMDFCKEFNARTAQYVPGTPIPARITVRPDRSFTFTLRTPTTAMFLLSAAGVAPVKNKLKGAGNTAGARTLASILSKPQEHSTTARVPSTDSNTRIDLSNRRVESKESRSPFSSSSSSAAAKSQAAVKSAMQSKGKQPTGSKEVRNGNAVLGTVGHPVSLKHVYEIAKIKQVDTPAASLIAVAASIVAQAGSMGVVIVP